MLAPIVETRDQRTAEYDLTALAVDEAQVCDYALLRNARVFFMKIGVALLKVVEEYIGERKHAPDSLLGCVAAGLDAGVESLLPRSREQCHEKIGLTEGLAARDGDPTARALIKRSVAEHVGDYLLHVCLPAVKLESPGGTNVGADASAVAKIAVYTVYPALEAMRPTGGGASAAADAFFLIVSEAR